ncbi:MAG: Recombination inhibitory protein MutS2 [Labilithrix sp.]|nr:Recombination inhibitory protein MutS2 [Labilithrix sp.]
MTLASTDQLRDPCPDKTRSDLEWNRLLGALASRCVSHMGRELARDLPFAATRSETRRLLAEAREATELLAAAEPLPVVELADVSSAIGRVGASGVLAPVEIREIGKALGAARLLRRYLSVRRSRAGALYEACSTDPTLDALADELASAFDPDGLLSDRASPRLKELRSEYQTARTRMLARLDDLMSKYEAILQDRYVTEREGRYVVPVRSDAHERFPGIVHSTSASGATLFVEPRAVIPMGNRLKVLEAEVQREEIAIYTRLSARIGESLASVIGAIDALARADVRAATARLAQDLRLAFPELTDDARLALSSARHPLLLLDMIEAMPQHTGSAHATDVAAESAFEAVVPSDLSIAARRAVVVSGPNAGGKTVALKTMGLTALMIRAGLPVACAAGSTVGIFEVVLSDVGDDQNMTKNLSTFSAHVRNLVRILDDTQPGALVLLDELAGGTDPREGEALAAGMLDSLTARGGAVVVTTHYEGLKALALADDRFENASMGFDLAEMSPTFRMAQGVPGSSSALAVARKFGLPGTVIERAERFLSREDLQFESVVKKLNDERAALELARAAAAQREAEAETLRASLESELHNARDREQRQLSKEAESLLGAVRRSREELREVQARLRAKKLDVASAKEAEKALDRVAAKVAIGGELEPFMVREATGGTSAPEGPVADAATLKKGARVWVPRLRAEADVLDMLGDGSVRVQAGAMRLVLPAAELRLATDKRDEAEPKKKAAAGATKPAGGAAPASRDPSGLEVALQTSDNTCDLRGLRADDAIALAVTFLDRSLNENRHVCFLVHGHGTGALKEAVRRELKSSPYVRFFRAGNPGEGGDGVTIAWLS